jgi:ankyrin repeat protein
MTDQDVLKELQEKFSDLLNDEADDPFEPINPITYHSPEGDSCLHLAAIRGDCRAIELLLDAGLDINELGDVGNTALHYAIKYQHDDVVALLIKRGAASDIKNEFGEACQPG